MEQPTPSSFQISLPCSPAQKRMKLENENCLPLPEPSLLGRKVFETMRSDNASCYTDITLICPDGTRIPAVRLILAMSSSYFEKLLISNFAEKDRTEIPIGLSSKQLREILEFIYIDDCPLIRIIRTDGYDSTVIDTTKDLLQLAFAAEYRCMNRLLLRCEDAIKSLCQAHRHVVTLIMPAMRQHHADWCKGIYRSVLQSCTVLFLKSLYYKCSRCNVSYSVTKLDNNAAEDVFSSLLQRSNFHARWASTYSDIFVVLLVWASNGTITDQIFEEACSGDLTLSSCGNIKILDLRLQTARKIASWHDLTLCQPKFISEVVEPSGLVEKSVIADAYKKISIRFQDCLIAERCLNKYTI